MQTDQPNIDLEQKIDAYIKGHLSEDETQALWTELLKKPQYIDYLQTEIDLTRYKRQNAASPFPRKPYWKWFAAAAAVVVLAVGLSLFFSDSPRDYTVRQIVLRDHLATSSVMRSGDTGYKSVDSLLNAGFESAINGRVNEALDTYRKVIAAYAHTNYAAKALLNVGIIKYNQREYKTAVKKFEKALPMIEQNHYMLDQAYWYLGNALVNTGAYNKAAKKLQKTNQLNGIHAERAAELLNQLNQERGNK